MATLYPMPGQCPRCGQQGRADELVWCFLICDCGDRTAFCPDCANPGEQRSLESAFVPDEGPRRQEAPRRSRTARRIPR